MSAIKNEKLILNSDNLHKIVKLCDKNFNIKFNKLEIDSLVRYMNELNINKMLYKFKFDIDEINIEIANSYKKYLEQRKNFDLQDYMIQNVTTGASKISSNVSYTTQPSSTAVATAVSAPIMQNTGNIPS